MDCIPFAQQTSQGSHTCLFPVVALTIRQPMLVGASRALLFAGGGLSLINIQSSINPYVSLADPQQHF